MCVGKTVLMSLVLHVPGKMIAGIFVGTQQKKIDSC